MEDIYIFVFVLTWTIRSIVEKNILVCCIRLFATPNLQSSDGIKHTVQTFSEITKQPVLAYLGDKTKNIQNCLALINLTHLLPLEYPTPTNITITPQTKSNHTRFNCSIFWAVALN
jgi:hypothetical protein